MTNKLLNINKFRSVIYSSCRCALQSGSEAHNLLREVLKFVSVKETPYAVKLRK